MLLTGNAFGRARDTSSPGGEFGEQQVHRVYLSEPPDGGLGRTLGGTLHLFYSGQGPLATLGRAHRGTE